ncbi:MAG: carbamoyltransferase HypF [Gammaproteobacteria bacterium]|nr:MAG: carbamoyltransferase HypF [Gammaproteobacteria bacterium]
MLIHETQPDHASQSASCADATIRTVVLRLAGHVQGVGFRPFVYQLARHYGLCGSVQNQLGEVEVIAQGYSDSLSGFEKDLIDQAPPLSKPHITSVETVSAEVFDSFLIVPSSDQSNAQIFVPPDYFTCPDCLREMQDPNDRRYHYPFINCTQCGPRYTLIRSLPYDRPNTSMADFPLCPQCAEEYEDPSDRRFHAEPVACPACGPQLSLASPDSMELLTREAALETALMRLRRGEVLAVKGIGGYHLMCDATNATAVEKLRQRKQRPDKPLAVMFPMTGTGGLDAVKSAVDLTAAETSLLCGPIRPIVLARKNSVATDLAENLAPGLRELGVFLPYSPLHQLLLDGFGGPLVATSGNLSGEPVLTENAEASRRLGKVADAFLHHDRPIVRPADDSLYRQIDDAMRPLRLGRGSAPTELILPWRQQQPLLAVGGHMKATITLSWDNRAVVSPHIGEMDSPRSLAIFEQVAEDLQALYGVRAQRIICDAHQGYTTHRWANEQQLPVTTVWHHRAHASALAAEIAAPGTWLVFTWDGVGLGEDSSLWGGEALLGEPGQWRRVCSMRPFRLPGGERAGREPWRSAAALHWETGRSWPECPDEDGLAKAAWQRQLNCPQSSATGRLFDAAAAIICGVRQTSFEAQGPMQLESMCRDIGATIAQPLGEDQEGVLRADWEPLLVEIRNNDKDPARRAETFHTSMATTLLEQARRMRDTHQIAQVGLAGGVFQNRVLTEQAVALLRRDGFDVYLSSELPCNDAALGYGQAAEIAALEQDTKS